MTPDETKENMQKSAPTHKPIIRCPKCRSINPGDAKYCSQCGKVFSQKTED